MALPPPPFTAALPRVLDASRGHPSWWLERKREAWERFLSAPMPARTDELWRFSTISGLTLDGYELPSDARGSCPAAADSFPSTASLTFINNIRTASAPLPPALAARGVVFTTLDEALRSHQNLLQEHFMSHPVSLGSTKFSDLHAALVTGGAVLYVPAGVEITEPFVVTHAASGDNAALFPHTLVILGDNARATLVERFLTCACCGAGAPRQFSSGVNDLHAGPGAQLTYVGMQDWSREALAFQTNSIAAARDAKILSLNLHLGGRQCRHESHSRLQGPGAFSEMLALTLASGSQEFDQRTLQTHQAPHTGSNLLYKNALLDTARTIFSGLIVVEPGAQKTDAYQSNRNLLLSPLAEANSLPGLEIQANDVRCTHGATSSQIDGEHLFYMRSRGIPVAAASRLFVLGFFEEVLDKLDNADVHAAFSALIRSRFVK